MKRTTWAAIALVALTVSLSSAQVARGLQIELGGGRFIPKGDSAAYVHDGARAIAGVEMGINGNLGLLIHGAYSTFKPNAGKLKADRGLPAGYVIEGESRIVELNVSPKLYLLNTDVLGAYFLLGGGVHFVHKEVKGSYMGQVMRAEKSARVPGLQGAFGVEVRIADAFNLGVRPGYHWLFPPEGPTAYASLDGYLKF